MRFLGTITSCLVILCLLEFYAVALQFSPLSSSSEFDKQPGLHNCVGGAVAALRL